MLRASAYLSAPGGSQFPQKLEREFYRSIKTSNGTKKSTALRGHERIRLFDDDILLPNPPQFAGCADVVRVANLIQPIYFTENQIQRAVENVRERCRGEGSIVVVCRNTAGSLDGSILRMTGARQFSVEARLGRGSEVEGYFTRVA